MDQPIFDHTGGREPGWEPWLAKLPEFNPAWPKETQDAWWAAFESIREAYPVRQRLVIPLSGGREVILSLPQNVTAQDIDRVSAYLDLLHKFWIEDHALRLATA